MDSNNTFEQEPPGLWHLDDLNGLLLWAAQLKASDVKLLSGTPIWIRLDGKWMTVTKRPLKGDEIYMIIDEMTRDEACATTVRAGNPKDFAYEINTGRGKKQGFRGNITACKEGFTIGAEVTLRISLPIPPTVEELGVEPWLLEAAIPDNGLVLVVGVMGSGKSTLIASILRYIIENQPRSVSTYEDPIEYDFSRIPNPMGPVSQAQIRKHIQKFEDSSRNAARRATDVILYGEARDLATMQGMLESAELGVLAYSTMHTRSVPETFSRFINKFPDMIQNQIATTFNATVRLIIQQRLLPKVGGGRVAIKEILAFDQDLRDQLTRTPINQLVPIVNEMLHAHGQPLLVDTTAKFEKGLISESDFLNIKREKEKLNGS